MALIDVVVVNYNSGPWLKKVVEGLHAQTFRDFRAVIIDNGSTDGSLERLPSGQASIEVVRAGANLGFAAGNNLAIREHALGEWLALLNPDAFPRPDWLERFIAAARAHPQYNFFGCRMLDAKDPTRLDGVGDVYHASGLPWREGHGCLDGPAYDAPEEIFSPCAAAALYRRRDVVDAGLFDEDFFCYTEDVDLGVPPAAPRRALPLCARRDRRAHRLGCQRRAQRFPALPRPPQPRLDLREEHARMALLALPALSPVPERLQRGGFALRGQGRVLWRAKRDAVKGLGGAWRKRRDIQARRISGPAELMRSMRLGLITKSCR